jgi:hemerythrin superfamily protein
MNVIDLLKSDHRKVKGLFESFESAKESDSGGQKQQVVEQICQELDVHAAVEEELFYPSVEKRAGEDEKAESSVKESYEEHALVKTLVSELKGMSAGGDGQQLDAKVKVLKELVQHHVGEEEGVLMPRAKKLLSSEELDDLGTQAARRKQELLGRSSSSEQPQSRRGATRSASAGDSSRRSASSRSASSGSSGSSRTSPAPSQRRSTASGSSRSSRSSGAPRGSRRRSSTQKGRSR